MYCKVYCNSQHNRVKVFRYNIYFGLKFNIIYLQPVNIKVSFNIFTESQTGKTCEITQDINQ